MRREIPCHHGQTRLPFAAQSEVRAQLNAAKGQSHKRTRACRAPTQYGRKNRNRPLRAPTLRYPCATDRSIYDAAMAAWGAGGSIAFFVTLYVVWLCEKRLFFS